MNYDPQGVPDYQKVQSSVSGPAIFLMVVAGLSIAMALLSVLGNLLGTGINAAQMSRFGGDQRMIQMMSGVIGIVMAVVWIIVNGVIFMGAMKMKNLQSHGMAMTAAILAMVPCLGGHPCCCWPLGLAAGIWSLVVLMKPEVKAAFPG
ncbi:MAG: hypothetical protein U0P81_06525 [Holophagaceae bacterium]